MFSIHIEHSEDGPGYKSIKNLRWDDIPPLAIVTGRNGAGKTHLLELIASRIDPQHPQMVEHDPERIYETGVRVKLIGRDYLPHEIALVPSTGRFSGGKAISIRQLSHLREQVTGDANLHRFSDDPAERLAARRIRRAVAESKSTGDSLTQRLEQDFDFLLSDVDVSNQLATIFFLHRLRMLQAIERGTPNVGQNGEDLGSPPWELVNDALATGRFRYSVVPPTEYDILENYSLILRDREANLEIPAANLSSGEKVILQISLWAFAANKAGVFPRLLLLDEPDAHLHPSMTIQFLEILEKVLVQKYGVQIIIATHSPSTVALAPDGSIFEVDTKSSDLKKIEARAEAIGVLTAGLVTVSRSTKLCFVEDESDVTFYETVVEVLRDRTSHNDLHELPASPSLIFIPASIGQGLGKIPGGATVVSKWVHKLDAQPLDRMFFGLIDRDERNKEDHRIFTIGRYSFENYLVDPINLYSLLIELGCAPAVEGADFRIGDEHLLRLQRAPVIQSITDAICARMEAQDVNLPPGARCAVQYTNGVEVVLSKWMIDYRGHDLIRIAQETFGSARLINTPRLQTAFRRCRVVPVDLADTLQRIIRA